MFTRLSRGPDLTFIVAITLIMVSTIAAPVLAIPSPSPQEMQSDLPCDPFGRCRPTLSCSSYERGRRPCSGNEVLIEFNRRRTTQCKLRCLNEDATQLAKCRRRRTRRSRNASRFKRVPCFDADPCERRIPCPEVRLVSFYK